MHVVKMIVFDIRGRPIKPATRGNKWGWFVDRDITLTCLDGSTMPKGESFHIRPFHNQRALMHYIDKHANIRPENVVYVSNRLRPLRRAKTKFRFLTLAVPPARAREYTDGVSTSFPSTASLARLINHLDWHFWPGSIHPENAPQKASGK